MLSNMASSHYLLLITLVATSCGVWLLYLKYNCYNEELNCN